MANDEITRRELGLGVSRALAGAATAVIGALGLLAARPPATEAVVLGVELARLSGVTLTDALILIPRPGALPLALSRRCPHLGCHVGLDAGGGGFTCPCHGSRFDAAGRRTAGPAARDLDPVALAVDARGRLVARGAT